VHPGSGLEADVTFPDDGDKVHAGEAEASSGDGADSEDPEVEGEPDAEAPEEPINRGLLLKFLSSVRN